MLVPGRRARTGVVAPCGEAPENAKLGSRTLAGGSTVGRPASSPMWLLCSLTGWRSPQSGPSQPADMLCEKHLRSCGSRNAAGVRICESASWDGGSAAHHMGMAFADNKFKSGNTKVLQIKGRTVDSHPNASS